MDQKSCHVCGNKLSKIVHKYTRIVEDIIPAQVCNTEYTISRRYCKCCKKTITPKIHTALPNERFGIRLAALLIVLKTLGLSYQKISQLLEMIYGIHMNESTINHAVKKTATAFGPLYEQMIRDLKTELNIHGDETSWRINGKNHWLWAFVGKWTTIYEIDKSRGRIAPMRVLKGYTDK
ncbi:MAG: Transposase [Cenarchaeum symbiont of Oopsacas minuta]|nr:Transposase [Cenarchaeum symbiont of Oopsacas minuta]